MTTTDSPIHGNSGMAVSSSTTTSLHPAIGNNGGNEGSHSMSPKTKRFKGECSSNEDAETNELSSSMAESSIAQMQPEDSDTDIPNTDPEGFFYSGQESPSK